MAAALGGLTLLVTVTREEEVGCSEDKLWHA